MRRLISDLCFVAALLLGIVVAAQAQFNSFPPGAFSNKAARDPAVAGGNLTVLDGSAQGSTVVAGTTVSVTLSTTSSNDKIVVSVLYNSVNTAFPVFAISDTAGLTWGSVRGFAVSGINNAFGLLEYVATSASPLTNDVITVTISATTYTFAVASAFGISGANTFDANGSLPSTLAGIGTSDPVTYSTSSANDFIFVLFRMNSQTNPTAGAGWTQIIGANFQLLEYKKVTAAQTTQTATIATGVGDANGGIVDAIVSN